MAASMLAQTGSAGEW